MAGTTFGRRKNKYQNCGSGRKSRNYKNKKRVKVGRSKLGWSLKNQEAIKKKLEEEKHNRLDPQRNHLQHHYHHPHHQNPPPVLNSRHHVGEEGEEDEENPDSSHQNQDSIFHLQQSYVDFDTDLLSPLPKKRFLLLPPPHPLPPSSSSPSIKEYARKMGEQQQTPTTRGMRSTITTTGVGEIVQVQGGHIVRSTGRKDRHSKVCTAKGPRDRRVRLSAHTAIQFYDVQDRLGYDRPSKAVDWLIKKAKAAIDQLAELPAWSPTATAQQQQINQILRREKPAAEDGLIGSSSRRGTAGTTTVVSGGGRMSQEFQQQQQFAEENNNSNKYNSAASGFLLPSMDAANHYHQQDLRLSLQSFQDHILLHHHQQQNQTQNQNQQMLFTGTNTLEFDGGGYSGWPEQQHRHGEEQEQEHDYGRFHRMVAWNAAVADAGNSGNGGGFVFNSPPPPTVAPAAVFGHHGQYFSQRGPLQSSNTPSIRAWIEPNSFADLSPAMHQASVYGGIGFASPSGGFSGFRIPARIQGEEEHDGVSYEPSSASSDYRH